MTTCHRRFLEARCRERGYTLDEVMPCVVAQNGDEWTINTESEHYPRTARAESTSARFTVASSHGVGTSLKTLLANFGFAASGDCKCNKRAAYINQMGIEWAEQNIDEIVGYLRESAQERGLPFLDMAGRVLVKRAIHNAKKATLE